MHEKLRRAAIVAGVALNLGAAQTAQAAKPSEAIPQNAPLDSRRDEILRQEQEARDKVHRDALESLVISLKNLIGVLERHILVVSEIRESASDSEKASLDKELENFREELINARQELAESEEELEKIKQKMLERRSK